MEDENGQQQGQGEGAKIDLDPAVPEQYGGVSAEEITEGKAMAILSYALSLISIPFFLVPLIMRNNEFSLFHSKQSMMIWIVAAANMTVSILLFWTCVIPIVCALIGLGLLVVDIIGIVSAAQGEFKPLPIIGPLGEKWFAGIRKVSGPPAG